MRRKTNTSANVLVLMLVATLCASVGTYLLEARDVAHAHSNPTLDAAEQAIRQATRAAQQTREAREYDLTLQRAEQTRVAGDATRVYAQTRAALDAYATRQAIDAHATRAAIESEATATAERHRQDAFATRQSADATATAAWATQATIHAATREAQTRAAIDATATIQAASAQATRAAIQRAAEYEERFLAARIAFLFALGLAVVAFAAVAIRALWQSPRPVVVETHATERAAHAAPIQAAPVHVQTDLPPTRVVCDPQAVQRITEILEFQEQDPNDDPSPRATH